MPEPTLFDLHEGTTPLFVSVPHAGTYVPPNIAARMSEAGRAVPDTDWFVHLLYAFAKDLGATFLVANWSRSVVDLNRPPDGAALYPGRRESALCPTQTFGGDSIYLPGRAPTEGEIEERKSRYWCPYHDVIESGLEKIKARHGRAVLWDAHSIRGTLPLLFEGNLPDLNFGTNDGKSCRAELIDRIVDGAAADGRFTYIVNGRFKGGYITRHYGAPDKKVNAIQLELAERSYMDEDASSRWDETRARPLQILLRKLLSDLTR
jgi:N-formylglutamate deformylase